MANLPSSSEPAQSEVKNLSDSHHEVKAHKIESKKQRYANEDNSLERGEISPGELKEKIESDKESVVVLSNM